MLLVFTLYLVLTASSASALAVDVFARDGDLSVDVTCGRLIDEDLQRALRSGLPARVQLEAELWKRRSTFFDQFLLDAQHELRVVYDVIDETFDIVDDYDQVLLRRGTIEEVEEIIGLFHDLPLCALDELDRDATYYVTVQLRVEPLSVEEVRDLEQWLRGGLHGDQRSSTLQRVSDQFLNIVKGRIGLGDREHDGKSRRFQVGGLEEN